MTESGESRIAGRRSSAQADGGVEYAAKRADLIRIATNVFHEKGYAATTLGDVAAVFGTDRASLYYYIGSKEELLRESLTGLARRNVDRAEAIVASEPDALARLRGLIELITRSLIEDYPTMQVYIQENLSAVEPRDPEWAATMQDLRERMEHCFISTIEAGIAASTIRGDVSPVLLANSLFGMMLWTHRWLVPDRTFSTDDLIGAFDKVFFEGVKPAH